MMGGLRTSYKTDIRSVITLKILFPFTICAEPKVQENTNLKAKQKQKQIFPGSIYN